MRKFYLLSILFFSFLAASIAQPDFHTILEIYPNEDNGNGGQIRVIPSQGQYPWVITFNGEEVASHTISGIPLGVHEITVTDGTGSSITKSIEMIPAPFNVTGDLVANIDCDTGLPCMDITITGAVPPISISNGIDIPIDYDPDNSEICSYYLVIDDRDYRQLIYIEDGNGTVMNQLIRVIKNGLYGEVTKEVIDCNSAILTVHPDSTNSNGPFTYSWGGLGNTQSVEIHEQGIYWVDYYSPAGCEGYNGFVHGIYFRPNVFEAKCANVHDGKILLSTTDLPGKAPGPNSFSWTGPNNYTSTHGNITNLAPGTYNLTVTAGNGCTRVFDPVVVPVSQGITTNNIIDNATCSDALDGSISFEISGDYPPFIIKVNGDTIENTVLENLAAGMYQVVIIDDEGCSLIDSVQVSAPAALSALITASDEACMGTASASVMATGGTPPYAYFWSNGDFLPSITDLIAGVYTVTVTDVNGCITIAEQEINSEIEISATSSLTDCNIADGTATLMVSNAGNDPTYLWNIGNTTPSISGLLANWYSVTVTNNETGCQVHTNIEVQEDPSCYVFIAGYVLLDELNPDCSTDPTTKIVENAKVELSDGQIVFTDEFGAYSFKADAGTYTIAATADEVIYTSLCSDPITVEADAWGQEYLQNDFHLKYGIDKDISLTVFKPIARPGFYHTVYLYLKNDGAIPADGEVSFIHPVQQSIISSEPAFNSYEPSDRTVIWDYNDLLPDEERIYRIRVRTPIGTALGTVLEHRFIATPNTDDLTPYNNDIICTELVSGSYDPNDKAVIPAGIGEDGIISMADSILNYRVRFQNTGTDTAFTVLIRDTLDADLDIASLIPGPSTHQYTAKITDGNVLELLFNNILLPDSFVNEPASNGHVFFDIKIKTGSPYGTRIENRAAIYFDYNDPVITNTVVNTIQMITSTTNIEDAIALTLAPNPTGSNTRLTYTLKTPEKISIILYDILGNKVKVLATDVDQTVGNHVLEIPDLDLSSGVYYLNLRTGSGGLSTTKLIYTK